MHTVAINMDDVSTHETQKEAIKDFIARIKALLSAGGFTYQALEMMCWVKSDDRKFPIYFYEARDIAHDNNWINDKGEWLAD